MSWSHVSPDLEAVLQDLTRVELPREVPAPRVLVLRLRQFGEARRPGPILRSKVVTHVRTVHRHEVARLLREAALLGNVADPRSQRDTFVAQEGAARLNALRSSRWKLERATAIRRTAESSPLAYAVRLLALDATGDATATPLGLALASHHVQPSAEAVFEAGKALIRLGEAPAALALVGSLSPRGLAARARYDLESLRGSAFAHLGRLPDAYASYRCAHEHLPRPFAAYNWLVLACMAEDEGEALLAGRALDDSTAGSERLPGPVDGDLLRTNPSTTRLARRLMEKLGDASTTVLSHLS